MGVYTASKTKSKLPSADKETGETSNCGCMPMEVVLASTSPLTSPAHERLSFSTSDYIKSWS